LTLIKINVDSKTETVLADVGPSPALNNPVKGLTLMDGGTAVATSIVRPRGDLWMAEGLVWRSRLERVLLFGR
jgi:hypothetical protein